jgi:hypothetical protein
MRAAWARTSSSATTRASPLKQGITHNGPESAVVPDEEGNGIYITESQVTEVRGLTIVGNAINSNRGLNAEGKRCKDGNGVAIENSGRLEDFTFQGNDVRLNFNNGVCIANAGDFSRSSVSNNTFHNNGTGDLQEDLGAPFGDGFAVYHDSTITGDDATNGWRIENITFSGNDYRENGGNAQCTGTLSGTSGLGFGVFLRSRARRDQPDHLRERDRHRELPRRLPPRHRYRRSRRTAPATSARSPGRTSRRARTRAIRHRNQDAANDYDVGDNGDGIALVTDNGDIDFDHRHQRDREPQRQLRPARGVRRQRRR